MAERKNFIMLLLTSFVVLISALVHLLHRQYGILTDYLLLQGMIGTAGTSNITLNVLLMMPFLLLVFGIYFYKKNRSHSIIPLLVTLSLTFASISIIAGGDGLIEYHFSIFMVVAMITTFQRISMIIISTVLFAIHHLGGYFFFPLLICGTEDYSFTLLMIHAIFLLLTSISTIIITVYAQRGEKAFALEREKVEQQIVQLNQEITTRVNELNVISQQLALEVATTKSSGLSINEALEQLVENAQKESETLTTSIKRNSENLHHFENINQFTTEAVILANNSMDEAKKGQETVQDVSTQMSVITDTVDNVKKMVTKLTDQSKEISSFLTIINSISEQTKLLALNASIEAARAGEHGKGFAVVANEIRNLASGTQDSAAEINRVITSIQHQVFDVSEKMDSGMDEILRGSSLISKSEETFDSIFQIISTLYNEMKHISQETTSLVAHTEEASQSFDSIIQSNDINSNNLSIISTAALDQYKSVEGLNVAIQSLNEVSSHLKDLITKIK